MKPLHLTKVPEMIALVLVTLFTGAMLTLVIFGIIKSNHIWELIIPTLLLLMWIITVSAYHTYGLWGLSFSVSGQWFLFAVFDMSFGNETSLLTQLSTLNMESFLLPISFFSTAVFVYLIFSMVFVIHVDETITLRRLTGRKSYAFDTIMLASSSKISEGTYILKVLFNDNRNLQWQLSTAQAQQWRELATQSGILIEDTEDISEFSFMAKGYYGDPLAYINYTTDEIVKLTAVTVAFLGSIYGYSIFGVIGALGGYIIAFILSAFVTNLVLMVV